MKTIIYFFLCFFLMKCSRKSCADSISVNRDSYKRYLILLEESKRPAKLVMPKEIEESITFLEVVSGIPSRASRSSFRSYENKADFKKDIKSWKDWYKKNKCKITLHYVDSVFHSLGLER